jgi:hypothetical protein
MDALAAAVPVVEADGTAPASDTVAIEAAARALKRWRHLHAYNDLHGRLTDKGNVKPSARYELEAESALNRSLDNLGCNPQARSRLGLNLARAHEYVAGAQRIDIADLDLRERLAELRESIARGRVPAEPEVDASDASASDGDA